jgi:hypothetical protein
MLMHDDVYHGLLLIHSNPHLVHVVLQVQQVVVAVLMVNLRT